MKYIDADKLIAEIERRRADAKLYDMSGGDAPIYDELLSIVASLQQEQPDVDLENYISNKLRELGADLINHKPYSFNRGLNVGKTKAYEDILGRINTRK